MTGVIASEVVAMAAALPVAVAEFADNSFSALSDEQLLEVMRYHEQARRRLEALDGLLIAEVDARNLPGRYVMRGTRQLLAGVLNLSPSESGPRVRQARELGPRVTVTGERLEPLLPAVAAARSDGLVSSKQVDVIIRAISSLRACPQLSADQLSDAERFLVDKAQLFDASTLANVAKQLIDTLNPDGVLADRVRQQRLRFLTCVPNGDGMYRLTADLDAETAALAMTVLHSLAAPRPAGKASQNAARNAAQKAAPAAAGADALAVTRTDLGASDSNGSDFGGADFDDGTDRDERTAGQRLHDAFRSVLKLALRSNELPQSGGVPATVLITMTKDQFESGTGLAVTSFGQQLQVAEALRLADQATIAWVVHNSAGGVLNYGRKQRVADKRQTLALIARDRGCAFPGCTDPPEWTERHHIQPWSQGGETNVNNLCLLCDHHHDRIETGGWQITMRDDIPWFTPPSWIDPEQKPRRNQRPDSG